MKCAFCNEHRAFFSRFCEKNSMLLILRTHMGHTGTYTHRMKIVEFPLCFVEMSELPQFAVLGSSADNTR